MKLLSMLLLVASAIAAPIPTSLSHDEVSLSPDEKRGGLVLAATGHKAAAAVTMASNDYKVAAIHQAGGVGNGNAAAVHMASNGHEALAMHQLNKGRMLEGDGLESSTLADVEADGEGAPDEKRGGLLLAATGHHNAAAVTMASNGHKVAALHQAGGLGNGNAATVHMASNGHGMLAMHRLNGR
mmetsp:Transcript_28569/g.94902  ORF Transcript_28569/g.94902 Transcript_28569/m.94902 type:complete len:184 (+) Transcript_28569:35-586(+)